MTGSLRVYFNIPKKLVEMGDLKLWSSSLVALLPKSGKPALVTEPVTGQNVNAVPCSVTPFDYQYFFYTFSAFKIVLINYLIFIERP